MTRKKPRRVLIRLDEVRLERHDPSQHEVATETKGSRPAVTDERWRRLTELFHNAIARDVVTRARYLDDACDADPALRADVDAMLAAHASPAQLLDVVTAIPADGARMLAGGAHVGTYQIERLIATGGMGAVFLAYDATLNRRIALKVVNVTADPEVSRTRLLREARNAAALNHPNICTIHQVGDAAGLTFIAMEFVDGQSLRERLDERALALQEAISYGVQTADALAHAHELEVIHRDLKAQNIIIGRNGQLKIVDFGLSRRTNALFGRLGNESLTQAGVAAGTPYAMAPEQIRGEPASAATDIWGLGVLLYEMVAGQQPFTGAATMELFASILRDTPVPLPQAIPGELKALIAQCLHRDVSERGTARECRERLRVIAQAFETAASAAITLGEDVRVPSSRPPRRRLVVMPFGNVSADPGSEYFADGLTEELIADLSAIDSLLVVSRTTTLRLKSSARDIRTIARDLNADLVLDGSVRRSSASIRVTAQLIDCATDAPLWAGKFSGSDADVFDLQEQLSRQIVDAMQIAVTPTQARSIAKRAIPDVRAYHLYLRARHQLSRFSAEDIDGSVALLRQGLELFGDNELLLATLGYAYVYYVHWGVRPDPRYLAEADVCADAVLRSWPDSPHGHALMGVLCLKRAQLQDAVRHLSRSVAADPVNTESMLWLVYCLLTAGQPRAARPLLETLLQLDPLTAINHAAYGWLHLTEGRIQDAVHHYRRAYDLDRNAPLMTFLWGWSLTQAGRRTEAIHHLATFAEAARQTTFGGLAAGLASALAGDRLAARRAIGSRVTAAAEHDEALAHFVSQVYAINGDFDDAYRWLEQALRRGFLDYPCLASGDPLYESFRQDARFVRLMPDVQRRWQAFEV